MFIEILNEKKAEILRDWQNRIFESYHPDARKFLQGERDRFNNPVGDCIKRETEILLTGLIEDAAAVKLAQSMDNFVRIRAVQDFSPSQAVNFMFLLKDVLKANFGEELRNPEAMKELIDFEIRIDRLMFLAFDLYTNCREQIYNIRLKEVKNRSAVLFEQSQRKTDLLDKNNNPNGGGVE